MTTTNDSGVNIDGDGNVVGLWFKPEDVEIDENAYIWLPADELRRLAYAILEMT